MLALPLLKIQYPLIQPKGHHKLERFTVASRFFALVVAPKICFSFDYVCS